MSDADDRTGSARVPPDGAAWRDAQRRVQERNEQARKAGRAERSAREKKELAHRRAQDEGGDIFR
jgi:hypothetical protein